MQHYSSLCAQTLISDKEKLFIVKKFKKLPGELQRMVTSPMTNSGVLDLFVLNRTTKYIYDKDDNIIDPKQY